MENVIIADAVQQTTFDTASASAETLLASFDPETVFLNAAATVTTNLANSNAVLAVTLSLEDVNDIESRRSTIEAAQVSGIAAVEAAKAAYDNIPSPSV